MFYGINYLQVEMFAFEKPKEILLVQVFYHTCLTTGVQFIPAYSFFNSKKVIP